MEFVIIAYQFLVPFLFISLLLTPKKYFYLIYRFIAVCNGTLFFNSVWVVYQLYTLYKWSKSNGLVGSDVYSKPSFYEVLFAIKVILPFMFLSVRARAGKILTLFMLVIFWYFWFISCYGIFIWDITLILIQMLSYISLFIALYALFWLTKKMPDMAFPDSCIQ